MLNTENQKEIISLIDYLRVVKKYWHIILYAFLLVPLIVLVISFFGPRYFQAKTSISIGQSQGSMEGVVTKLLENLVNVHEVNGRVRVISLGDGYIQVQTQGETAEQAKERLSRAIDVLIEKYKQLTQQRQDLINHQKSDVDKQLAITQDWIDFFQKSIKQGISLDRGQAYAMSLNAYLSRLSILEAKQFEMEQAMTVGVTRIQDEPIITAISPRARLKDDLFLGSVVGLFLGLITVFVKNWWQINKLKI